MICSHTNYVKPAKKQYFRIRTAKPNFVNLSYYEKVPTLYLFFVSRLQFSR